MTTSWSLLRLLWLVLFCGSFATGQAMACTERTMLDFIGSLEAPEGYDQVFSRVSVQPPRPITAMTVDEVLEWQSLASRTSVSSAAGRYQVIRATLQGLVDQGVVARNEPFDSALQDRIGTHLLRQTGYRNGVASPVVANRVAGIWAALPLVSGPGQGYSAYEGYAGNHSLVTAETYLDVLQCTKSVDEAQKEAATIRSGTRIGFEFDSIIEAVLETSETLAKSLKPVALWLLITLAVIDLVVVMGRVQIKGAGLEELLKDMAFRILTLAFLSFIILNIDVIVHTIANAGVRLGTEITANDGVSLAAYARAKTILIFSFSEGAGMMPTYESHTIYGIGLFVALLTGLIMGMVVFAYAKLFIGAIIGVLAAGLGGLSATRDAAQALVFRIIGGSLQLLMLMIIMQIGLTFAQSMRGTTAGLTAALIAFLADIVVLYLCWCLPPSIARLVEG
ncbi:hypothetical protein [uncultured Ruegeria sp.]|uniref:hypothetical protein n=1 Tax=uncultured Ruegeria sp. TaxID=259304 RepID=UPI002620228B|nr:hypothetical protein [uncultured Ruegeria sp.]